MPIIVFGNSSPSYVNVYKIDTSLFVRVPYLRTNSIEVNIEEDFDLKNQYRVKKLPDSVSVRKAWSKKYVDNKFNDPSRIKNNSPPIDIDMNDKKNLTNVDFIEVTLKSVDIEFICGQWYFL